MNGSAKEQGYLSDSNSIISGSPPTLAQSELMSPRNKVVPAGRPIRLWCFFHSEAPYQVTWVKQYNLTDRHRSIGPRVSESYFEANLTTLYLEDLIEQDSAYYSCIASNSFGSANFTYYVSVFNVPSQRPVILDKGMSDAHAEPGGTVSFTCNVESAASALELELIRFPNLTTRVTTLSDWDTVKSYVVLLESNLPSYFERAERVSLKDNVLTIENVTDSDVGYYGCIAMSNHGEAIKTSFLSINHGHSLLQSAKMKDETIEKLSKFNWYMIGIAIIVSIIAFASLACCLIVKMTTKTNVTIQANQSFIIQRKKVIVEYKDSFDGAFDATGNSKQHEYINCQSYHVNRGHITSSSSDNGTVETLLYDSFGSGTEGKLIMPTIKIVTVDLETSSVDDFKKTIGEYFFPLDPKWEIPPERFQLESEKIGEGAFGVVYKGSIFGLSCSARGYTEVAVKMLKPGHSESDVKDLIREMEVMKKVSGHRNIINLLGCITQDGQLKVLVELAPHGNLRDFLRKHRPTNSTESFFHSCHLTLTNSSNGGVKDWAFNRKLIAYSTIVGYAHQIAKGMEYLISRGCIHRDLAARNVLVGDGEVMKIADFGLARDVEKSNYYTKTTEGRLPIKWMAPETLFDQRYTHKSDVWSFGIVLWELLTLGATPYPSISAQELFEKLRNSEYRMDKPSNCPSDLYHLMSWCWKRSPSDRPTFTQVASYLETLPASSITFNNETYLNVPSATFIETPSNSDDENDHSEDLDNELAQEEEKDGHSPQQVSLCNSSYYNTNSQAAANAPTLCTLYDQPKGFIKGRINLSSGNANIGRYYNTLGHSGNRSRVASNAEYFLNNKQTNAQLPLRPLKPGSSLEDVHSSSDDSSVLEYGFAFREPTMV